MTVVLAFLANILVAIAKTVAAVITGNLEDWADQIPKP